MTANDPAFFCPDLDAFLEELSQDKPVDSAEECVQPIIRIATKNEEKVLLAAIYPNVGSPLDARMQIVLTDSRQNQTKIDARWAKLAASVYRASATSVNDKVERFFVPVITWCKVSCEPSASVPSGSPESGKRKNEEPTHSDDVQIIYDSTVSTAKISKSAKILPGTSPKTCKSIPSTSRDSVKRRLSSEDGAIPILPGSSVLKSRRTLEPPAEKLKLRFDSKKFWMDCKLLRRDFVNELINVFYLEINGTLTLFFYERGSPPPKIGVDLRTRSLLPEMARALFFTECSGTVQYCNCYIDDSDNAYKAILQLQKEEEKGERLRLRHVFSVGSVHTMKVLKKGTKWLVALRDPSIKIIRLEIYGRIYEHLIQKTSRNGFFDLMVANVGILFIGDALGYIAIGPFPEVANNIAVHYLGMDDTKLYPRCTKLPYQCEHESLDQYFNLCYNHVMAAGAEITEMTFLVTEVFCSAITVAVEIHYKWVEKTQYEWLTGSWGTHLARYSKENDERSYKRVLIGQSKELQLNDISYLTKLYELTKPNFNPARGTVIWRAFPQGVDVNLNSRSASDGELVIPINEKFIKTVSIRPALRPTKPEDFKAMPIKKPQKCSAEITLKQGDDEQLLLNEEHCYARAPSLKKGENEHDYSSSSRAADVSPQLGENVGKTPASYSSLIGVSTTGVMPIVHEENDRATRQIVQETLDYVMNLVTEYEATYTSETGEQVGGDPLRGIPPLQPPTGSAAESNRPTVRKRRIKITPRRNDLLKPQPMRLT